MEELSRIKLEQKYIKAMDEIAADTLRRGLKAKREELRDSAPSRERQRQQLAKLPEAERVVVEVVVEEKGQTPQYVNEK